MKVIDARNVSEAYRLGMQMISVLGVRESSRAGEVLAIPDPVTTVYRRPMERLLLDERRDANPFFHLLEAVWMLAGRRDATWLDTYVRDFSSRFAEADGDAHGAYGHRWRQHFPSPVSDGEHVSMDQLSMAGEMMFEDPTTRRVVISMWDPTTDLGARKRDIPCNTQIMLRGRRDHIDGVWELDVTVTCRSNDAVWGAYGANAVHMSIMAELLAALSGMRLGVYRQVSNNLHAYTDLLQRYWPVSQETDLYTLGQIRPTPMIRPMSSGTPEERMRVRTEARMLLEMCEEFCDVGPTEKLTSGNWIGDVVNPMALVHQRHRDRLPEEALGACRYIGASDWKLAAREWILRRARSAPSTDTRSV